MNDKKNKNAVSLDPDERYRVESDAARKLAAAQARSLIETLSRYAEKMESAEPLGEFLGEDSLLDFNVRSRIRVFRTAHAHVRAVFAHGVEEDE